MKILVAICVFLLASQYSKCQVTLQDLPIMKNGENMKFYDFNQDGYQDIFLKGKDLEEENIQKLFLGEPEDTFRPINLLYDNNGSTTFWLDINNDYVKDRVVLNADKTILWVYGQSQNLRDTLLQVQAPIKGVHLFDIELDGHQELLIRQADKWSMVKFDYKIPIIRELTLPDLIEYEMEFLHDYKNRKLKIYLSGIDRNGNIWEKILVTDHRFDLTELHFQALPPSNNYVIAAEFPDLSKGFLTFTQSVNQSSYTVRLNSSNELLSIPDTLGKIEGLHISIAPHANSDGYIVSGISPLNGTQTHHINYYIVKSDRVEKLGEEKKSLLSPTHFYTSGNHILYTEISDDGKIENHIKRVDSSSSENSFPFITIEEREKGFSIEISEVQRGEIWALQIRAKNQHGYNLKYPSSDYQHLLISDRENYDNSYHFDLPEGLYDVEITSIDLNSPERRLTKQFNGITSTGKISIYPFDIDCYKSFGEVRAPFGLLGNWRINSDLYQHLPANNIFINLNENDTVVFESILNSTSLIIDQEIIPFSPSTPFNKFFVHNFCQGDSIKISSRYSTNFLTNSSNTLYEFNISEYNYSIWGNDTLFYSEMTPNGCEYYDTLIIQVNRPSLTENTTDTYRCPGDYTTIRPNWENWEWIEIYPFTGEKYTQNNIKVRNTTNIVMYRGVDTWGCKIIDSLQFTPLPTMGGFIQDSLSICSGDTIFLSGHFLETDSLEVDGMYLLEKSPERLALLSREVGLFKLENVRKLGECELVDSLLVQVKEIPPFHFQKLDTICDNSLNYLAAVSSHIETVNWFKEEEFYSNQNPIIADASELASPRYKITFLNGCSVEGTIVQQLLQRKVENQFTSQFNCEELSYFSQLDSIELYTDFEWIINDQSFRESKVKYNASDQVLLLTEQNNLCRYIDTVNVLPLPFFINNHIQLTECYGETLNLASINYINNQQDNSSFLWFSNRVLLSDSLTLNIDVRSDSLIELYSHFNDCIIDTMTISIRAMSLPEIDLPDTIVSGIGETTTINLSEYGNYTWNWRPNYFFDYTSNTQIAFTATYPQTIWGRAIHSNGCSNSFSIHISPSNRIFIPNTFSPNNDQINDTFNIYGNGIDYVNLTIYDLRGKVLYRIKTKDIKEIEWDGKYNGLESNTGIYFWEISGRYVNGQKITYNHSNTGTIQLIR